MFVLEDKNVLVLGLGVSGVAAAELLTARGARVVAIDAADSAPLQEQAARLRAHGVTVLLGANQIPPAPRVPVRAGMRVARPATKKASFEFAVLSPGVGLENKFVLELKAAGIPFIGELELGYQQSLALNISITGTNGKTTTTELVEQILTANRRITVAAGNIGTPLCAIADQTRALDFITLEVSSFQLETIAVFSTGGVGVDEHHSGSSRSLRQHGGLRPSQSSHLREPTAL